MNITSLILSDDGLVFITSEKTDVINDEVILKNYFDNLSKKGIKKMTRNSDKTVSTIIFNDDTRIKFQNFNEIRRKTFCKELNKEISLFKFKALAKKLVNKKVIVIGSIVGVATVSVINLDVQDDITVSAVTDIDDTKSDKTVEEFLKPIEIKMHDIDDEVLETEAVNNEPIVENISDNYDDSIPTIEDDNDAGWQTENIHDDDIDPLSYIKDDNEEKDNDNLSPVQEDDELDVDPLSLIENGEDEDEIEEYFDVPNIKNPVTDKPLSYVSKQLTINENIFNDGLDYTKLETLKDINNYEGFILLAANLYGVPYDKAVEVVKNNYQEFTTPGKVVNDQYAQEIDRMKDLVNRGFINGDLNVIGIFLTIKDYAIDYQNLSKQPAIYSDKAQEEREKEILYIAKYIYGIDDAYLLNLLIATTRVESANFTSAATINKNNIGGNMSTAGTFEHPVLNTYKTAEIGEESFVRNFLNCYGKSLVAHNYDRTLPIPYVMKDKLCPHTPDEWEKVITEKVEYVEASGVVDAYLNNTSKAL